MTDKMKYLQHLFSQRKLYQKVLQLQATSPVRDWNDSLHNNQLHTHHDGCLQQVADQFQLRNYWCQPIECTLCGLIRNTQIQYYFLNC